MLSSRLVLPERYGPHSATTRCAPLPGLPPGMVSDFMSAMTTSSFLRVRSRTKTPDEGRYRTRPERSLVLEMLSPRGGGVNVAAGEDSFECALQRRRQTELSRQAGPTSGAEGCAAPVR